MAPELSVSLAGLESDAGAPWEAGPRAAIEWAADAGFRSVTLDGTAAGARARELDRSGRRDLAALLRRLHLGFAGIDLWIPPEHLADAAKAERALGAVIGSMELAADVARLLGGPAAVLHLSLPKQMPGALLREIDAAAESCGVAVADYGPDPQPLGGEARRGIGIDPAALLLAGGEPADEVLKAGSSLRGVRLSDADETGRVAPGSSRARLDGARYIGSVIGAGYAGDVVLDLRGVREQGRAANAARRWWGRVTALGA
jgi:sugar phosphate isomerase/epimerase